MNDFAIITTQLGKRYRIGAATRYLTLRESIVNFFQVTLSKVLFFSKHKYSKIKSDNFIWALNGVSIKIKQGERVGIIGLNGAGKSTLLKVLSRITPPTSGTAEINGRVATLLEVGTGFHPELTGRENIYLYGAIIGMKKKELDRKFDAIVKFAEIEKFIDTPVKRYSSGMYVRLAFAVSSHMETDILFVDEVLSVGDIAFQKKCLERMQTISKHDGCTIFFVSHQMATLKILCDKIIWMQDGKIHRYGPALEIIRDFEKNSIKHLELSPTAIRKGDFNRGQDFYISKVDIVDSENKPEQIFEYNNFLRLIVTVQGECDHNYGIEFYIYKSTGEFVALGASIYYHNMYFEKNIKKVCIDIGPITLTNGTYMLSFSLLAGNQRIDTWNHACSFEIAGCHPFPSGCIVDQKSICVIDHNFSIKE